MWQGVRALPLFARKEIENMDREFWKAAFARAWHAAWETAVATAPTSIIITPAMIQYFDISYVYVALAWILTALAAAALSLFKSAAQQILGSGLPEIAAAKVVDTMHDTGEPEEIEDAFFEDEDEESEAI